MTVNMSAKMKKYWADPEYRARVSTKMSNGAKRRWADKAKRAALLEAIRNPEVRARNAASSALGRIRNQAERLGIPFEEYSAMTSYERFKHGATHRRIKLVGTPSKTARKWAALLNLSVEDYVLMSGNERRKLRYFAFESKRCKEAYKTKKGKKK